MTYVEKEAVLNRSENADPMVPDLFEVKSLNRELDDTYTLTVTLPEGMDGFKFAPGQFNMLYKFGVGEVPISISGDPEATGELVHTIRNVGPVTDSMSYLRPGDIIGVRGPFGSSWPVEQAEGKDVVVIAGGIGLAPLRPAILHCMKHRNRYGDLVLYYGARSPSEILFDRELDRWRGQGFHVEETVDHAEPSWTGHVGVVTHLIDRRDFNPEKTIAFICGPEIMMRYAVQSLRDAGVPSDQVYVSMERNMKCAVGFCGRCQYGPVFICRDGPVFPYDKIAPFMKTREI